MNVTLLLAVDSFSQKKKKKSEHFSVDAFAAAVSLSQLNECRMSDLHELAAHWGISVSCVLHKTELKVAHLQWEEEKEEREFQL